MVHANDLPHAYWVGVSVPAVLGANGVEKIIELKLTPDELAQLKKVRRPRS